MFGDGELEAARLRPGEYRILMVLRKGLRSFSELKGETMLPGSVLSEYLKRLQEIGLIERDIRTRKYRIKTPSDKIMEAYKPFLSVIGDAESWIKRLGEISDRELAERLLENTLKFNIFREAAFITLMLQFEASLESPDDKSLERARAALEVYTIPNIMEMLRVCLASREIAKAATERIFNDILSLERETAKKIGETFQELMRRREAGGA